MSNNSFENPVILNPVDYSRGIQNQLRAIEGIGSSLASLAQQRKKAYDELVSDYEEYNKLTTIDAAKSLDAQQQNAIRASVSTNLQDFSFMSPEEKQSNLQYVRDVKAAQESLDYIIDTVRDPNVVLDKRADANFYAFWNDLKNMRNIEIIPRTEGIGFKVKHSLTDEEGNPTGDFIEYDQNELIGMTSMVEDTGDVLDSVDKKIKDAASQLYKDQVNAKNANRHWDRKAALGRARELFKRMNKNEKEIYFSEHVMPFQDLAPSQIFDPETGETRILSKTEKTDLLKANEESLFEFMMERVDERTPEYHKPVTDYKPPTPSIRGVPSETEVNAAKDFKKNVHRFQTSGDESYINQYLNNANIDVEVEKTKEGDPTGKIRFIKNRKSEVTESINGKEVKVNKDTKEILDEGDIRDANFIYQAIRKWSQEIPYLRYLEREETQLNQEELDESDLTFGTKRDFDEEFKGNGAINSTKKKPKFN